MSSSMYILYIYPVRVPAILACSPSFNHQTKSLLPWIKPHMPPIPPSPKIKNQKSSEERRGHITHSQRRLILPSPQKNVAEHGIASVLKRKCIVAHTQIARTKKGCGFPAVLSNPNLHTTQSQTCSCKPWQQPSSHLIYISTFFSFPRAWLARDWSLPSHISIL